MTNKDLVLLFILSTIRISVRLWQDEKAMAVTIEQILLFHSVFNILT